MPIRVSSAISFIGREALRIVLPSWCVVCRAELPWRDRVASCCGPCWRSLPRLADTKCRTCALPLPVIGQCIACSNERQPLEWCEAWGEYRDGVEGALHAFKFERHDFLDAPFAGLMAEVVSRRGDDGFDALIPVPMHRRKQRKRGYNQAELLAEALGKTLKIRSDRSLLAKSVEKRTQSTLARDERAANVRGTYHVQRDVRDLSLLLVDDICTTGETLRACARELLDAGASRVCAVTVAKAV